MPTPPPPDERLNQLIGLARTQVLAQVIHTDNYDLRLMGLLGFNGALIVVDITLKETFGSWWWTPLIALTVSSFLCVWPQKPAAASSPAAAANSADGFSDIGPNPKDFLEEYPTSVSPKFQAQLLADLGQALQNNRLQMAQKQQRLRYVLLALFAAMICGILVAIGFAKIANEEAHLVRTDVHLAATGWHWLTPRISEGAEKVAHIAGDIWSALGEIIGSVVPWS